MKIQMSVLLRRRELGSFVLHLLHNIWSRGLQPAGRTLARGWRTIRRREVWPWVFTWVVCIALGFLALAPLGILTVPLGILGLLAFFALILRSPFTGLVAWVVISPIINSFLRGRLPVSIPMFTFDRAILGMLFIAYLYGLKKNERPAEQNWALHLWGLLFVGIMFIDCLRAPEVRDSVRLVLDAYALPLLVYMFARRWVNNTKAMNVVLAAMICVGVYFTLFAIPEHFLGHTIFRPTQWVEAELSTVRIQGPADSPTEFGIIVVGAVVLCLFKIALARSKGTQMLYMLLTGLMLVGLAMTLRRSVYVGAAMALLTIMVYSRQARRVAGVIVFGGIIVCLLAWPLLSQSKVYKTRIISMDPIYSRMVLQSTAVNIIKHHPINGIGVDNFGPAVMRYAVRYRDVMPWHTYSLTSPHNMFLRILVEGGLLAFIPFIMMIIYMGVSSVRAYRRTTRSGLLGRDGIVAFWAFSIATLSQSFQGDAMLYCQHLTYFWFFYLGSISGFHLQRKDPTANTDVPAAAPVMKEFAVTKGNLLS